MQLALRQLGKTDIFVSPIGLGTVKLGRNTNVKYPTAFTIPDDKQVLQLLDTARAYNINVLDTAPAYGNSEERLGKLLRDQRHDWIIMSKVGEEYENNQSHYNFSAKHIAYSIKRSLQRLQTDYLDIVLVHSDGNDLEIIQQHYVFETLKDIKQQGLIRSFGMSTKTSDGGLQTIEHPDTDVAMITYNPSYTNEYPVIAKAHSLQKGILVKKAFASGHLPVQTSIDFILQEPAVTSVIVGTINPEHLVENARHAVKF